MIKKERYELKHQQKLDEQVQTARKKIGKKILKIVLVVLLVSGGIGWFIWYVGNQPKTLESEIISRNGLHWHPELTIYIKGVKQEIPANIGIGLTHEPIHTHDNSGVLHLEFSGLVIKDDIKLSHFFKIWKKQFNSNGTVKMFVNGKENREFENYLMQDNDKIEIRYE